MVGDNESLMGTDISKKYSHKLPFLFKVLSINKALSIQAHPNKKLAEQLHARDPKNYPDDNHKPEMTIAITPFDGLCGFRPLKEIAHFLKTVPSLREMGCAPAPFVQPGVSALNNAGVDPARSRLPSGLNRTWPLASKPPAAVTSLAGLANTSACQLFGAVLRKDRVMRCGPPCAS